MLKLLLLLPLIFCLVCLAVWLARQFYFAAKEKGYAYARYFWLSLLLGPVGWLAVIALPDRGKPNDPPAGNPKQAFT